MASRSMKSPAVSASLGPAPVSTDDEGGFAREHVSVPSDGVPLDQCLTREWLVTDGLGGYASGSVPGPHTRRYHGLLVAPLAPPLGRHVLLSHLDELVSGVAGATPVSLSSHEFEDGTIHPRGLDHLRSFELIDGRPTWIHRAAPLGTGTVRQLDGGGTSCTGRNEPGDSIMWRTCTASAHFQRQCRKARH
ncbi:MAG: hypothetical protein EBZ89_08905 [Chloroflexi bacterium]|nr:hypothetical protein [Chloroflexota bacterium]